MLIEENKPLAPLTTFGIGGPARWFVEAATEEDVVESAAWARGTGRTCLCWAAEATCWFRMRDSTGWCCTWRLRGIAALQMRAGWRAVSCRQPGKTGTVCGAKPRGCCCGHGVPGGDSGHGRRDAGAERGRVRAGSGFGDRAGAGFRPTGAEFVEFSGDECGFSYRRSRFNSTDEGRYVVTRVDYRLTSRAVRRNCIMQNCRGNLPAVRRRDWWKLRRPCGASGRAKACCWWRVIPIAAAREASSRTRW